MSKDVLESYQFEDKSCILPSIDPMHNNEVRDLTGYSRKITTGMRCKRFFLKANLNDINFYCHFSFVLDDNLFC